MEWLQKVWQEYGPVIMTFVGSGFGALVMGFIANFTAKIAANKITGTLDVNKIVSEVTERVTQNVCRTLTGNVLDVDISALVNEKLDETLGEITEQVKEVKASVNSMKECSALTAKAIGKSKLLDQSEQAALSAEAEKLSESVTRAEKPVTKIRLQAKGSVSEISAAPNEEILKL